MVNHPNNQTAWQNLPAGEKRLLFERLQERIGSRVSEMVELRRFFVKALVASNATAAAATLAFVGGVKEGSAQHTIVAACGYATLAFVIGFIAAICFLSVVVSRSRETVIAESEYLNEIVVNGAPIDWHNNPKIMRLSPWKFAAGLLFASISAICLIVGVALVLYLLIVIVPTSLATAPKI